MKKLIAVIAIAMVFALSLSATNLTSEINKAKSLPKSNNEKGVMLKAIANSGKTDFVLYETPKIDLNVINFTLVINNKHTTYVFAFDSWMSESGYYAVHTSDNHIIIFVDWAAVNGIKMSEPNVKISGLDK